MAWNKWTDARFSEITRKLKARRVALFVSSLGLSEAHSILDFGSEDGSYLAQFYPWPQNIVLADIDEKPMRKGVERYGLKGWICVPEEGPLPVADRSFDAVWCNSVVEHVTVPFMPIKEFSDPSFRIEAEKHQSAFAREISRVGKAYFVQTPYLHCPIEAHSWLPGVQYVSQEAKFKIAKICAKFWVKQWRPDFLLYDLARFRAHYPDASRIHIERVLGLPKSLIAIRTFAEGVSS